MPLHEHAVLYGYRFCYKNSWLFHIYKQNNLLRKYWELNNAQGYKPYKI